MNDPELYSRASPFQIRDAAQVLGVYRKRMGGEAGDGTDTVLDIGCGTGDVTSGILAPAIGRFEMLLGVDKSRDMVGYAQQHNSSATVHYEVLDIAGDVESFAADWGQFSRVFSFYCLHWVSDLGRALANVRRLLRPRGECLLVFVAQCPVFEMYARVAEMPKWKDYMKDVNEFIPVTQRSTQPSFVFSGLMEDAGLTSVSCDTLSRSFAFTSTKMLTDCMVAVNPFVKRVALQQRNEYIEDCIKVLSAIKMEKGNINENEACCFSYKLIVAQGTRN